jgi:hypothetical protein
MSEIPPHKTIAILDAISLFGAYIINVRRIETTFKKNNSLHAFMYKGIDLK